MTDNFPGTAHANNAEPEVLWTCPTCSLAASMPYCNACGERKPHPDELTLRGLSKQAFEAFTSYDSRLWHTFRKLMFAPGGLTLMYLEGSRKPYLGPFAVFLLANVLFVAMEALTGSNAFSTPLAQMIGENIQPWSVFLGVDLAPMVARHLQQTGTTLEVFMPVYDQAVANNSKSFVFLMVVPLALINVLLFARQRRAFATHLVYALHFYAFMLTFMSCTMFFMWLDLLAGGERFAASVADDILTYTLFAVCILYLHISAVSVYQPGPLARIFKTAALVAAGVVIFLGYRLLLFVITLYTV
jgi:hypothetical protein